MGMWGLLTAVAAHGQSPYIIQHYTNENGLPANGIKGIELDTTTGFLWVGTQAGLVRFDGKNFTSFSSPKKELAASRIAFIAKNREETIYCEDENFSVYRITGSQPVFELTDTFLVARYANEGYNHPAQYAFRLAQQLRHVKRSSLLPHWIVFHDESGDSSSFSFTCFGDVYHYSDARDTLLNFRDFKYIFKVDGRVYFAKSDLEVWEYNDQQQQLLAVGLTGMAVLQGATPRLIWTPGMQAPLLIYKRNIWRLQRTGDTLALQSFCQACCPADAYIYNAQLWEKQGLIFLGSEKNGLYIVRKPFLRTIRTDTLVEAGRAEYAQAEMEPGMITTGYGLTFSVQGKLLYRKGGMPFHPWGIYRDQDGDHWCHSGDTLIHLHRKDGHSTKMAIGSGFNKMVFCQTKNRLYVITEKVIADITGDQYQPIYQLPYSAAALKNTLDPDAVIEWKPGILAIATEKLVLYNTDKGGTPDTIPIPGLTAKVRTLRKYGDYLFIGTYGQGFYVYKNGVVKKMPLDKNKYLAYAHCFMPDEQGYCWISTNHGLFKASLQALTAAYEENLTEIYYHYFGKDDGLFNTELNGGCQPCALKLSSGLFSFPTMNGVAVLDPRRPSPPPPSGELFIDEVLADSHSFQPGDSALQALPYNLRNLRFRLSLPRFGNSENIYFSYKLTPYDEEWESQDILQNNTLQFGGLKPGRYTLYLRVRNGYGPDEFGISSFVFRILPPWYQSWWFYTLCGLGFFVLMWGVVKWRTARINKRKKELQQLVAQQTEDIAEQSRQLASHLHQLQSQQVMLEEDNKIKTRLIGIISHDMMSPLRFMGYLGTKLRDSFSGAEPAHKTADSFVRVTQELESLTVNMLNWIKFHHSSLQVKPERFNVHELVAESVEIASTLAREKGILLYNDVPPDAGFFQYRQAIGVIVYNLAMNAMKYTKAGEIRVSCRCTEENLSLTVSDTGPGMPAELAAMLNSEDEFVPIHSTGDTKRNQFGYVIIKDLLRLVNGTLQVESTAEGTRITVACFLAA